MALAHAAFYAAIIRGIQREAEAALDVSGDACQRCAATHQVTWAGAFDKWLCVDCRMILTDRLLDGDAAEETIVVESGTARVMREARARQRASMEDAHGGVCPACGSPLVVDLIDISDAGDVARRMMPALRHCRHDYQDALGPSRTRLVGGPCDGRELHQVPRHEEICVTHPPLTDAIAEPSPYPREAPIAHYRRDRPHGDLMLYRYVGSVNSPTGDDAA